MTEQYVITQDTEGLFGQLDVKTGQDIEFKKNSKQYFDSLATILSQTLGPDVSLVKFYESEIEEALGSKVIPILQDDPNALCICLDRTLLNTVENDLLLNSQFVRFGMCRTIDGKKEPRQGQKSFEEQCADLKKTYPDIADKKVIVVDDGLFTGGTVKEFIDIARQNDVELRIEKIIGFIGNSAAESVNSIPTEIVKSVTNLYDWIDIRDFSVLGGKKYQSSKANNVTTAVPYIYPWSNGASASLNTAPGFFDASQEMIEAFVKLVREYETANGKRLRFRDLVKAGFPLPTNISKTLPISINVGVVEYLNRCRDMINQERMRQVYIFDMDGTLYELDGAKKGFKGSRLEGQVLMRAKRFIMEREDIGEQVASQLLGVALSDEIGVSRFLSERYGISRKDYFDFVWDIDPDGIITNYTMSQEVLRVLKKNDPSIKFIILTSAPKKWAQKVLSYLELDDLFESVYTGEQYGKKDEIFYMLSGRYKGEVTSVGDQLQTDIMPAEKLGMNTVKVDGPDDLESLILDIGGILCH